jgi:RimJ/RimL family protein N-acetyltransferase
VSGPAVAAARRKAARAAAQGAFTMPRVVRTPRLALSPLSAMDTAEFQRFWDDEESARFVGGRTDATGAWRRLATFAGQWALHGFGHYALRDTSGEFVGFAGLWFPRDWPEIEIAYCLMPEARGTGLAAEAVRAIHAVAMELGAPSLVSYISADNAASQQVAMAAGAGQDGSFTVRGETVLVFRYPEEHGAVPPHDQELTDAPWDARAMPGAIGTRRLVLTQWRSDHFARVAQLSGDPESMRYTGGTMDEAAAWREFAATAGHWMLRGYGIYAVEAEGRLVGGVGLYRPLGWPEIELGWSLTADARGNGYATEAATAVRDIAAEQGMRRLASFIHPDNAASRNVAERLGATVEGEIVLNGAPAIVHRHVMDEARQPAPARH